MSSFLIINRFRPRLHSARFMNDQIVSAPGPARWFPAARYGRFAAALLCLVLARPDRAAAQANGAPPQQVAYQGFLTDGSGTPLAANAPQSYGMVFRVWSDPVATATTNRLWTEAQTVSVSQGVFTVVLGQGNNYLAEARPGLATLFAAPDASNRYVELTVRGIGTGGSDVTVLPRMRLLPAPYAFLATSTAGLITSTGSNLVTSTGGGINVNGSLTTANGSITAASFNGALNGSNLAAGSVGSAQLTAGAVGSNQLAAGAVGPGAIAAGSVGSAQIVNGAVGTTQLAPGAVGATHLANGAVGASQLASGSVGAAQLATNFALWTATSTNIYYDASDISIGTAATNRNLTVTGNLNVQGGLNTAIGTSLYQAHNPVVYYSTTPTDSSTQHIISFDVKPFANRPGGFKIRMYGQQTTSPYNVVATESTVVFEQPGYAPGDTSFTSGASVRGAMTTGYIPAISYISIGTPSTGATYNYLTQAGVVNQVTYFALCDYNPMTGYKNADTSTYTLYALVSAGWDGYVVVSDY